MAVRPYTGPMHGLLALAIAMGIGRFAFTPLLPMMQAGAGVTLAQGGWLASANYVGYLVGALMAVTLHWSAAATIRVGLGAVGITTVAMGFTQDFAAWMALRFAAGVTSAWVLVFVSAWGFERVAVVFSGVGTGIAVAGLICVGLMAAAATPATAWITLGVVALVATVIIAPAFRTPARAANGAVAPLAWTPESRRLVACYGAFGFGYIIPATFLPAMARQASADPAVFAWAWPVFGAAAAASTLTTDRLRRSLGDRRVWILGHVVMAVGVVVPVIADWIPACAGMTSLAGMTLSAVLVGGTFMVVTMAGFQEARRVAGPGARTLIAAMTSAFAAGQIAGPLLVAIGPGFTGSLLAAGTFLVASAFILWRTS